MQLRHRLSRILPLALVTAGALGVAVALILPPQVTAASWTGQTTARDALTIRTGSIDLLVGPVGQETRSPSFPDFSALEMSPPFSKEQTISVKNGGTAPLQFRVRDEAIETRFGDLAASMTATLTGDGFDRSDWVTLNPGDARTLTAQIAWNGDEVGETEATALTITFEAESLPRA